jgi:serine/threonine protein phosphatase PrpC/CRP-like cAMP-binding protein
MHILASGRSEAGRKTDHNEDYFLVDADLSVYLVCDGVGGLAAGEVAAQTAAQAVKRHVVEHKRTLETFDGSASARDALLRLVDDAIQFASREVFSVATSDAGRAGMGTTLTMVIVAKDFGVMGHVGDSRLYLRRSASTHQLSEDHTYASEAIRRGLMTAEEAQTGPYAHVITRAVGLQYSVRADTLLFDILPGDTLMLCTGGVHRWVEGAERDRLLDGGSLETMADELLRVARLAGARNDATTVVLRAESDEGDADRDLGRASEVNLRIDTLRRVVIFRHLDMREICKVLNIVRVVEEEPGKAIIGEGEGSDALYAILHGTLRVERGEQLVRTLTAGDHFGEMALFNNRPRSASVAAHTRCGLLVIERAKFNELLRTEPALSVKILWCFAQVLSLRLDDVTALLYDDADKPTSDAEELRSSPFKVGG